MFNFFKKKQPEAVNVAQPTPTNTEKEEPKQKTPKIKKTAKDIATEKED